MYPPYKRKPRASVGRGLQTLRQLFEKHRATSNRQLLWHGSRLTNWVGILSQGLRIAPPEAPVTGYMFGKGVYFADMSSKSANYCKPHTQPPPSLSPSIAFSLSR